VVVLIGLLEHGAKSDAMRRVRRVCLVQQALHALHLSQKMPIVEAPNFR